MQFRLRAPSLEFWVDVRLRAFEDRWLAVANISGAHEIGLGPSARQALAAALSCLGDGAAAALLADPQFHWRHARDRLGIILAQHVPGWRPIRTLLFLPFLISGAALATVFAMVYNPRYGLLNEVVTWLGLPARDWLAQTDNCARRGDCHLRVHHRLSGRSRDG